MVVLPQNQPTLVMLLFMFLDATAGGRPIKWTPREALGIHATQLHWKWLHMARGRCRSGEGKASYTIVHIFLKPLLHHQLSIIIPFHSASPCLLSLSTDGASAVGCALVQCCRKSWCQASSFTSMFCS